MKRSLLLVLMSVLAVSSLHAATARENKRLQEGKITKNEAEHLVLRQFPGATIKRCELKRGRDHSVWMVDVVKSGAHDVTKVQIDGRSGKFLP